MLPRLKLGLYSQATADGPKLITVSGYKWQAAGRM